MDTKSGKNKIVALYILATIITLVITLILFSVFFLSDKIVPFFGSIIERANETSSGEDVSPKLTVSQETENYQALIDKYTNYLNSNYLIVVNSENPLPEDYAPPALSSISNSARQLEERAAAALEQLIAAADAAGCERHIVISGYRSAEEQTQAFNTQVQAYMASGYTQTEAEALSAASVARAGESEFQTGLLVELGESRNMTSDEFINTDFYNFLKDNAHLYGFVLRYPENKETITGYSFNSMVFRYVGNVESSTYIYENNLSLEEYIDYIRIAKLDAEQNLEFLRENN